MDLVILVIGLACIGFLVWALITYVPMPPVFKTVIVVFVTIIVILYLVRHMSLNIPNVLN